MSPETSRVVARRRSRVFIDFFMSTPPESIALRNFRYTLSRRRVTTFGHHFRLLPEAVHSTTSGSHTIEDMSTRSARLSRFLSSGSVEIGLAGVFFTMEALTYRPDDPVWALPLAFATCAGAAMTAWHARIGAIVACLGLLGLLLQPSAAVGFSLYAPLIVVLSCAWHNKPWTATAVSIWSYAVSLWATLQDTTTTVEIAQAAVLWLGIYALPWIVGLSLRQAQIAERQRLRARFDAQRHEVAAELHDNVTHSLGLITIAAESARIDPNIDPKDALADVATRARSTSSYLTNLMKLLRIDSPSPPVSFSRELQSGAKTLTEAGFEVQIYTEGDVEAIPPVISNVLGRIAREAFNNIARHGDPSESCEASVAISERRIAVTFTNATTQAYRGDELGIVGMRERAEGIGGTVVTRLTDGYWSVAVSIPLSAADPSD